jgi:toxin ParE1/3/4
MSGYALTPKARADLENIWTYSAERWDVAQADEYLRKIRLAVELVAADPSKARSCNQVRAEYFQYPAGSHMLFFKQDGDRILIVRILHQSMDFQRHL